MNPIDLLRRIVAIPSTPGAGRETDVARILLAEATEIGFDAAVIEPQSGKGSLVASVDGATKERILLLAHSDVAPAEASEWRALPFEASARCGAVWGRGSVDAKGLAVVWLTAMARIARTRVQLRRGIALLVASDEESGGAFGTSCVLDRAAEHGLQFDDCVAAFGEGGGYRFHWRGREFVTAQTGECGRVRLRTERFSRPEWVGREAFWSETTTTLVRTLVPRASDDMARLDALRRLSFPLDVAAAVRCKARLRGNGEVVLTYPPSCGADAALDAFCAENRLQHAERSVLSSEPPAESPFDNEFADAVRGVVRERFPRATVLPVITPGQSDNRFLRRRNIPTCGFFPFLRLNTARRQHQPNERLPFVELADAVDAATRLLEWLCLE